MSTQTISSDTKSPVTVDNSSGKPIHTPAKRIDLASINDVRLEMAATFRAMKSGDIDPSDGTKFVYVLGQIGRFIETHEVEKRMEALENTLLKRNK